MKVSQNIRREELKHLRERRSREKKKKRKKIDVFFVLFLNERWKRAPEELVPACQETEALRAGRAAPRRNAALEGQEGTKRRIGTEGVRAGEGVRWGDSSTSSTSATG